MTETPMFRLIAVFKEPPPILDLVPELGHIGAVAGAQVSVRRNEQLPGGQTPDFHSVLEVRCRNLDTLDAVDSKLETLTLPVARLRTREHYLVDHGVSADAVKGVFLFRRRQDLPLAEFQRYWLLHHGPIASRTPDIQRYVQCHVLPDSYAAGSPVYDGVTEIYWPDYDTTVQSMGSDSMTVEQAGDAPNFVAPGSVDLLLTREQQIG
jgi:uncharacterized protein (TIGR02118 family)